MDSQQSKIKTGIKQANEGLSPDLKNVEEEVRMAISRTFQTHDRIESFNKRFS